jgi:calcineurin-like phosphoesterase family protein
MPYMSHPRRLAALGGSYGNVAALSACLADARDQRANVTAFLGDSIGCCGHSEETVRLVREHASVLVAGNHEQEAAKDSQSCGCGYASPEDEAVSCEAFRLATASLLPETRAWLGTWPNREFVELEGGRVLLCHGSPGQTAEFLYEAELDDLRLEAWLDKFDVRGFVCTHSGLPWIRRLRGGRFAINCGAVGKADHDGDPAVHYALLDLPASGEASLDIRRVAYDHESFARRMEEQGIADVFVEPIRTGVWTTGVASLPASERYRPLRREHAPVPKAPDWTPERLWRDRFREVLGQFRDLRLVSAAESEEVLSQLDPDFPFFASVRLADSLHVHVKVDDTKELPHARILELGGRPENEREGYVKYAFEGGINMIFSSIDVAEEDALPPTRGKPRVDHTGIDLRREAGTTCARFDEVPAIAQRIGWAHTPQGGRGRAVYCCHVLVSAKHWVYPPAEGSPFTFPVEFAYGPLLVSGEVAGCDLRPIDPRHPAARDFARCEAPAPLTPTDGPVGLAPREGGPDGRLLSLGRSRALR